MNHRIPVSYTHLDVYKRQAQILQTAADAGEIKMDDALSASEDLLGLWLGFSIIEKRFQSGPPQIERLSARIDRGLSLIHI